MSPNGDAAVAAARARALLAKWDLMRRVPFEDAPRLARLIFGISSAANVYDAAFAPRETEAYETWRAAWEVRHVMPELATIVDDAFKLIAFSKAVILATLPKG